MSVVTGLNNIRFPVYKIGDEKPQETEGVHYFVYGKDVEDSDGKIVMKVVDDKKVDKPSLALRRLEIQKSGAKLYKLSKAIFFLQDLIKITKSTTWFIDTEGQVFQYKKSKRVNLVFRKVTKVLPIRTGGAIIEVEGLPFRFKTLFEPTNARYAGLLSIGTAYILYGVYPEKPEDTYRYI